MLDREFKITKAEEGAAFAVHVVPKSVKNEVVGKHGDALKVRLTSNFLAEKLSVDQDSIEIAAGLDSTEKMIVVLGLTPVEVESRLLG
jgi:uncharacterized protein YggU (UPF0235/DUF167 family)